MLRLLLYPVAVLFLAVSSLDGQVLSRLLGYFPEDFFRGHGMSPPAISPDGDTVAFFVSSRDRNQIRLFHVGEKRETVLHSTASADQSFHSAAWAGQSRLVYQDQRGNWYSIQTPNGNPTQIFSSRGHYIGWGLIAIGDFWSAQLFSRLLNDDEHVLLQTEDRRGRAQVVRVNLKDGSETVIQRPHGSIDEWIPTLSGDVIAGTRYLRDRIEFRYRSPGTRRWQNLDRFVPERRHSFSYSGRSLPTRRFQFLTFAEDNHSLYYASDTRTDTRAIYRMDIRTGEQSQIAYDPDYDLFSDHNPGQGPLFSAKGNRLVGIHYHREKPHTHWLDPAFEEVQQRVDQLNPNSINRILDFDNSENHFVVASISSRSKGSYFLYDKNADSIVEFGVVDERLDPELLGLMQPVSFEGRHGHQIPSYLTMPKGVSTEDTASVPLVVLVHGGPWVRDIYGYHPEVQLLAYKGYAVLQVNFRGSTGYGFEHFDAIRQRYGSVAVEDIEDAMDAALIQFPQLNSEAVAVMGASYGAYAGMNLLLSRPDRYKAGILIMGLYDIEKQARYLREIDRHYSSGYWDEMVGSVWDSDALRSISPLHRVSELQSPILVIHGEEDDIVPVEQSRQLVRKLNDADKPNQSYLMRSEGHGIESEQEIIAVYSRVLDFLETQFRE
ncbi:MAG: S9 family peptidase [Opitutales bacterium]|nr:S9 family peptidase [Opitutales bacterium]